MADFKVITSDILKLQISTPKDQACFDEKRFKKDLTVADLKVKLELITGGNCNTMQLEVYSKENKLVCALDDNSRLLGSYPIEDGMRLHVIDKFNIRNELESGDVEKFELDDEEYSKKADSVRAFLMKNKMGLSTNLYTIITHILDAALHHYVPLQLKYLNSTKMHLYPSPSQYVLTTPGQYNEDNLKKKEKLEAEEKQLAESTPIGSRCKVLVPNAPSRLGTVMYAGPVETLPGYWIGVKYDEPLGKNNGTFKGKKYFECPDNYGGFVKPHNVECGDFPEEDYDLDEEI